MKPPPRTPSVQPRNSLRGALPAGEAEALVDLLLGQRVERPDPERDLLRLEAVVQAGLLGQQRQRAVAGDDQRRLDDVVDPGHPHAPHRAVAHHQALDAAAGEQGDARGHRLLRVPAVEQRPEEREAGEASGRRSSRRPTDGRSEPEAAWKTSEVDEPSPATESIRLVTARSQGARSQKSGTSCSGAGQ